MGRKKIIVMYSTAGMGHKKAAIAVHKVLEKENVDIEIVDALEYTTSMYRFFYFDAYIFLMSQGKLLWGFLYWLTNIPFINRLTRKLRGIADYKGLPGLGRMLAEKAPDAIVTTHFLLPSIAGILRKKNMQARIYTIMTDYGPHSFWLSDQIDRFFVGSDSAKEKLSKRNISIDKITATGIPTADEFIKETNINSLRRKYGLDFDKKTVFLMSGGFGVGPVEKILLSLDSCMADIQIIAVCGHNKKAYANIKKLSSKLKYTLIPFGFTDKVAELMAVSDIMITKAGGISVTEALNAKLPMILFGSIPGQEAWNEKFLIESQAALKARKISDIPVLADKILLSEEDYKVFREGIENIRRPHAAEDIVKVVMGELER